LASSMGPDANHFVCRYLPGPVAKEWEPLDMPATSPLEPADPIEAAWRGKRTHFDRVEVELEWVADPTDDEVAARADEGHPFEVAKAIRAEKLDAFFGPSGEADPMFSAHRAPKDALWIPYDGFPLNWGTVRILERLVLAYYREEKADVAERIKALGTVADDDPEAQRLRALDSDLTNVSMRISRAFYNDARLGGHEPVPEDMKEQVRAFLEDLRVNGMPSSKERTYRHRALPTLVNDWITFAAVHGAEAGLLDKDAAKLIPAEVVAALAQRHSARKHQMLGEGQVVQVAADDMKERYILLLQLGPDATLNWTVGEMGPLQYWITPEDLAARRFENTLLTIEAY
jgi:Domain of unknown function (DUF1963)